MWAAFARTHYERVNTRYAGDVTDDDCGLIEPLFRRRSEVAATNHGSTRGIERDPLSDPRRLSLGHAAEGVSAEGHGVRLFPTFLAGRYLASDLDIPVDAGALFVIDYQVDRRSLALVMYFTPWRDLVSFTDVAQHCAS